MKAVRVKDKKYNIDNIIIEATNKLRDPKTKNDPIVIIAKNLGTMSITTLRMLNDIADGIDENLMA